MITCSSWAATQLLLLLLLWLLLQPEALGSCFSFSFCFLLPPASEKQGWCSPWHWDSLQCGSRCECYPYVQCKEMHVLGHIVCAVRAGVVVLRGCSNAVWRPTACTNTTLGYVASYHLESGKHCPKLVTQH